MLGRSLRGIVAVPMVAIALAACGSSSPTSTTSSGATPPTPSPTPAGPPSGSGTAVGDANVSGPITVTSLFCSWPGTDGPGIRVFADLTNQPSGVQLVILIQAQTVNVKAATGSGATYAQREFNGPGVSNFDGTKGATVDTTLTEDKSQGTHPGTIGAMSSIKLTVACGNEQPGTASLTVTGNVPGGALSGQLTSARVDCTTYPQGNNADVTALTQVGGSPMLIIVGVYWGGITVSVDGHFYTNTDPASGTATSTGAHWSGDVSEQNSGGTLHVSGDATCGSSTKT